MALEGSELPCSCMDAPGAAVCAQKAKIFNRAYDNVQGSSVRARIFLPPPARHRSHCATRGSDNIVRLPAVTVSTWLFAGPRIIIQPQSLFCMPCKCCCQNSRFSLPCSLPVGGAHAFASSDDSQTLKECTLDLCSLYARRKFSAGMCNQRGHVW